jgi:hypothetical protein
MRPQKWRRQKLSNIADTRSCRCASGKDGVQRRIPPELIYPSLHNLLSTLWHLGSNPRWPQPSGASTAFWLLWIDLLASERRSMTEEQAARSICAILAKRGGRVVPFTMITDELRDIFERSNGTTHGFDSGLRFAEDRRLITRHDRQVWLA